ncbi:MAG TPA: multicopper oxidase family protein [Lysobacter sp.]
MDEAPANPARRKLIVAGVAAAALGTAGYFAIGRRQGSALLHKYQERFTRPLRIPGRSHRLGEGSESASRGITLQTGVFPQPLLEGTSTDVWAYAQRTPAGEIQLNPTLFARSGEMLDVTLHNRLGDDTTIHWHGFSVDERNDGSGLHPVRHGERFQYRFPVANRSGLYWYHAHPHSQTGMQVHHGLAGLVVVEDEEELALQKALGLEWGSNDIALMVSDKQFGLRNKIVYEMAADDWIGSKVLINWTTDPYLEAGAGWLRLRLANGSNARLYRIAFALSDKELLPFRLLGTDSGLLAAPAEVESVFLSPGQRLDVLLDLSRFDAGDALMMRSLPYDPMENDATTGMPEDPMMEHPGATPMGETIDLMLIKVTGDRARATGALPNTLSAFAQGIHEDARKRPFRLWLQDSGRWMINNWNFHLSHGHSVFEVKRGTTEIWEITNDMRSMPHPIHVHGFQYIVTGRRNSPPAQSKDAVDGRGRAPQDLGLLDTVLVWPGETVSIQIDFSQPHAGAQRYMFHCHNLEHEDQGMMVHFAVVD